jgi:hypothetical protein
MANNSSVTCTCAVLKDPAVVDMADTASTLDLFERIKERGEPYWWLYAARCTICDTHWLVAQEERQNDVILLRRLTAGEVAEIVNADQWPSDFDRYETLLRLGRAAGHTVLWADPIGDSSLRWTMADLARQRPGISVAELAELLDLDEETAAIIADRTRIEHGVSISNGEPWR